MVHSITWVTASYFLQVDLPLLSELKKDFTIHWIFVGGAPDKKKTASEYAIKYGIDLEMLTIAGHWLNPKQYSCYAQLAQKIKAINDDICYLNISGFPYALFAFDKYIPSEKIVMAMHHGKIHSGMKLTWIYKYYLRYLCNRPFQFQYFSETQAAYFSGKRGRRTVIPLALNNFGMSNGTPSTSYVQFLFFGNIIENKNLELLIEAACKLKESCDIPFKVKIVGHCRNWSGYYKEKIKYNNIFDLEIKTVPDDEIPQIFSTSHYLVLPYKSVTQSGPLRIAYAYNLPVIASDLDGFKESVIDGVTGILFRSEDVNSLMEVMHNLVKGGQDIYKNIREKQEAYVKNHLTVSSVVTKYKNMFNSIIENNDGIEK